MRIATLLLAAFALTLSPSTPAKAQNKYLERGESALLLQGGYSWAGLAGNGLGANSLSGGVALSYGGVLSLGLQGGRLSFDAEDLEGVDDDDLVESATALSSTLGFMAVRQGQEAAPLNIELAAVYQLTTTTGVSAGQEETATVSSVSGGVFLSHDVSENSSSVFAPELGALYTPYYSQGSITPGLAVQLAMGMGGALSETVRLTLEPSLAYETRAGQVTAGLALGVISVP